MEWVESIGDSVELAKEHALDRLGVHEDDAEFDVLSEVKVGMFGRIKEPARVRARVRPKTPRAKDHRNNRDRGSGKRNHQRRDRRPQDRFSQERSSQGRSTRDRSDDTSNLKRQAKTSEKTSSSDRQTPRKRANQNRQTSYQPSKGVETVIEDQEMMPLPQQADLAEAFVSGLAECFGTNVRFERKNIGTDEIRITVSGDEIGRMVGRRGATAGAIDDLVRTFLQRRAGSARNGRIRVDIGGVIARRNAALAQFAREQALEVQATGVSRSLEPMNAADRKIVHDAVDGTESVTTTSEGDDPQRYVVIVAARD